MSQKPNILFLFADDQRFDTIHELGNESIMTPNLDQLVKSGTSFTHAFVPSGTSPAVCMPSRCMLHTGRHLFSLQGEGQEVPEDHALMGETFQNAGYRTFGTGKWHNGTRSYARSFSHGDEIFFGGMDDHWNVPAYHFDASGKYENRTYKVKDYMCSNKRDTFISDHVVAGKHSTELFAEATSKFIRNYEAEEPFFAYVSFMAPHDPRTMPDRFKDMYSVDDMDLPKNFMSYHKIEYDNVNCRDEVLAPYPRTVEDTKVQLLEYYAMITHIDEEVGKVIGSLKESGQFENTLIIYTADNGLALGQHGLFGKQCHYDHSVRVPFIIAGPGIPKNERRDAFIYLLDIFPTLCDVIGMTIPDSVEGKSFLKCIKDPDQSIREDLYFAYTDKIRSFRTKEFKLMEHVYKDQLTTQLFDMSTDVLELANIAHNPEMKETVQAMKNKMKEYRDAWGELEHLMGHHYWSQYEAACLGK